MKAFIDEYDTCDDIMKLSSWYNSPLEKNPEYAINRVMAIDTDLSELQKIRERYNNDSNDNLLDNNNWKERLIGYIILHALSHNAGYYHIAGGISSGLPRGVGFGTDGYNHECYLKICPDDIMGNSFESIISKTEKHLVNAINHRFNY